MDGIHTPSAPPAAVTAVSPRAAAAPVPAAPVLPPATPSPSQPEILLAWPRSAQWAAAVLVVLAALLLAANAWGLGSFWARPLELDHGESCRYRVDLNQASVAELMQIPGVGPKMAERIDQYRRKHGRFQSVQDLRRIDKVGPKTFQRLLPWVSVDGISEDHAAEAILPVRERMAVAPAVKEKMAAAPPQEKPAARKPPEAKPAVKKEKVYTGPKLNVNTATAEQLMQLNGIGPKKAQAIITARTIRPFQSINDLRRAKGIGPKTLEKLRPHVTLD